MEATFYYKNGKAPKPNRPNHIGTSIIIWYEDKVLLEHRVDSDRWAIIGGGLKTDEDLKSCIIRETLEETGLKLSEDEVCFYKMYDDPSRIASYPDGNVLRVVTVVYDVHLKEYPKLICSDESRELKFWPVSELSEVKIAETHIPIIEDIICQS